MTVLYIIIGLGVLYGISKLLFSFKDHKKSLNVIHAKHTFKQLSNNKKQEVESKTSMILERNYPHRSNLDSLTKQERFNMYSLAMAQLNIPPADTEYSWNYDKRPLVFGKDFQEDLESTRRWFNKKHEVGVDSF